MPNKIEVKTGKPSDATCISWHYQPDELEKAKYTAKEFFDNCTRIWTHPQQDERGRTNTERPFFLRIVRKGKRKYKDQQGHKESKDSKREQAEDNQSKAGKEIKRKANT